MVFSSAKQIISRRKMLAGALIGLVALTVSFFQVSPANAASEPKDADVAELMKPGAMPEHVMGKPDAPFTIVEYSSLTCSHCAAFHKDVFPELKKKYIDTGKARYILREFPIDDLAAAGFMLAHCVESEKYFDFIETLYGRQEEWAFVEKPLPVMQKLAKEAGIHDDRFKQCLTNEKVLKYIEETRERASKKFGIHGTPSFFVNGKSVVNDNTIKPFEKIIEGK